MAARRAPRSRGKGPGHERARDLLKRDFTAPAPSRRWVADFTQVAALAGTVCIAFAVDIFSRMIVGRAAAGHKRAKLVLDALDMALWHRSRAGRRPGPGLVHHSDYAEVCVKPRNPDSAVSRGLARLIPRLNDVVLPQAVEGL